MKESPLPIALQLSKTLDVPPEVWTGNESYKAREIMIKAREVARAQKGIVDHLNAEGLQTLRGKPLTVNSIRAVLKNKKYIGIYHYDGKEFPDVNFPALIDTGTFAKVRRMPVQNRLASNGTIDLLLGKI